MTKAQAAAYINAQAACAMATITAMQARNTADALAGRTPTHTPADFEAVPDHYGIHHNAALTTFQQAMDD